MSYTPRFLGAPTGHSFLLGPRGTGKTQWTRHHYPEALYLDLLQPETLRALMARPERLRELIAAHQGSPQVVIDEVQKLPALLDLIHALIEEKSGIQFILTGSSARKLRREGVNLLGGRAGNKTLHPYMATELGDRFNLTEALQNGLLPVVVESPDPKGVRTAYCGMYLQEEVRAEGLVRQIDGFARFLEAVSFSHAGVLNLSNISRECQVGRKTVEGYLGILEDLLLAFRLPVFTRRAQRQLAAHAKFFLFDAGLYRTLRPTGPLDTPADIDGAALEGLVAQHLRAWCDYSAGDHRLHYWQTRSQVEVDFVVYGAGGLHAFEVKNSAAVRPEDLRGLKAFGEDYPEAGRTLLYRGTERLLRDGILCLPVTDFLTKLRPDHMPG